MLSGKDRSLSELLPESHAGSLPENGTWQQVH